MYKRQITYPDSTIQQVNHWTSSELTRVRQLISDLLSDPVGDGISYVAIWRPLERAASVLLHSIIRTNAV